MIEINKYLSECYPKEACGFIIDNSVWYPCGNIAEDPYTNFKISQKDYKAASKLGKITKVVHSHCDVPATPSAEDIAGCNIVGIPYLIISYPSMQSFLLQPSTIPLLGREYSFGYYDCLQLAIDYYKQFGIELRTRDDYIDDWWKSGLNYFNHEYIESWGFRKVVNKQQGDLLLFSIHSDVPNHCGVYIGQDHFIHHAVNRLSAREALFPSWNKFITGIYRYEKKS